MIEGHAFLYRFTQYVALKARRMGNPVFRWLAKLHLAILVVVETFHAFPRDLATQMYCTIHVQLLFSKHSPTKRSHLTRICTCTPYRHQKQSDLCVWGRAQPTHRLSFQSSRGHAWICCEQSTCVVQAVHRQLRAVWINLLLLHLGAALVPGTRRFRRAARGSVHPFECLLYSAQSKIHSPGADKTTNC